MGQISRVDRTQIFEYPIRTTPLSAQTALLGSFSSSHSFNPPMFAAVFEVLGLDCVPLVFDVKPENLGNALIGWRALNVIGGTVTMPHKVRVMEYLDEIDPIAKAIGAVNGIVNEGGKLVGFNTDYSGFQYALKDECLKGKKVVLLGAGGAGRAVAFGLCELGADITILNVIEEDAKTVANNVSDYFETKVKYALWTAQSLEKELADAHMVVNATSVGFGAQVDETPVPQKLIRQDMIVYDIVFNPGRTRFMREAQEAGARKVISGTKMLVAQAVEILKRVTGVEPPFDLMYDTTLKLLFPDSYREYLPR